MKKYIRTSNGKEVKIGDIIKLYSISKTPFGEAKITVIKPLTQEFLEDLIKEGEVTVIEDYPKAKKEVPQEKQDKELEYDKVWDTVVANLVKKTGWKEKKLWAILTNIAALNPSAVLQIFIREIAIELDKKYKDHINKCDIIYTISTLDGRIHKLEKKYIKTFRSISAFRSMEDAKIACYLLKSQLRQLYKND